MLYSLRYDCVLQNPMYSIHILKHTVKEALSKITLIFIDIGQIYRSVVFGEM